MSFNNRPGSKQEAGKWPCGIGGGSGSHRARRAEKDIGTPNPDGESSIDPLIPIPFLLAPLLFPYATTDVSSSLATSLLIPFLRPFFSLYFCLFLYTFSMRFDVPSEKLTRVLCLPYLLQRLFPCEFLASIDFHSNFFLFFRSPICLSIRVSTFLYPFQSYLFVCRSIPDLSLSHGSLSPFFPIILHLV